MLSVEVVVAVQGFSPGDGAKPSTATASAALNLLCASRRLLALLFGGNAGKGVADVMLRVGGTSLLRWLHGSSAFAGRLCYMTGVELPHCCDFSRVQQLLFESIYSAGGDE